MSFQSIVITVATILLIVVLTLIAISLWRGKEDAQYPPVVADCPDYWADMSDGDASNCVNTKSLGEPSCKGPMNFSTAQYTGPSGLCNKQKWAKSCNLTWDGVTNNNDACASQQ